MKKGRYLSLEEWNWKDAQNGFDWSQPKHKTTLFQKIKNWFKRKTK